MAMSHELRLRQRELLDQLEELDEAVTELTALLRDYAGDDDDDDVMEQREHLAWLHRQQAGVLVILSETERVLVASDE